MGLIVACPMHVVGGVLPEGSYVYATCNLACEVLLGGVFVCVCVCLVELLGVLVIWLWLVGCCLGTLMCACHNIMCAIARWCLCVCVLGGVAECLCHYWCW